MLQSYEKSGEKPNKFGFLRLYYIPTLYWHIQHTFENYHSADGEYYNSYTYPEVPERNMTVVDATLNPSTSQPLEIVELTLTIHNDDDTDYTGDLYVTPYYYGDINPDDIATSNLKLFGNYEKSGAYLRAGQDAEVKFYMKLKMNGVVLLEVSTEQLDYLNSYVIVIEAPTDPTSISAGSISADDSDASDAHYYDLQGHRLNTPPVQPGVYIYKGKKVVFPFYDKEKR